jgi:3-hydroxyisobutyrate dehydrogenase-like beta-hydroxyacid dehydrogenase
MAVGVIGAGEMGSAVAGRLRDGGCSVVVSLEGRSDTSRRRLSALGLTSVQTMREIVEHAGMVLSIVPPGQALQVSGACAAALHASPKPLTYVDCNAVSPRTVREIEGVVRAAGASFVDAGIIGGPPRPGEAGPIVFVCGNESDDAIALRAAGLDVRALGPAVGSASALKMSYAGVTKGLTALCALMQQHARANGLGAELDATLRETRPELWTFLEKAVPGMYPKSYRWIAEMREIADYTAPDDAGQQIYHGVAQFFERIASEAVTRAS